MTTKKTAKKKSNTLLAEAVLLVRTAHNGDITRAREAWANKAKAFLKKVDADNG